MCNLCVCLLNGCQVCWGCWLICCSKCFNYYIQNNIIGKWANKGPSTFHYIIYINEGHVGLPYIHERLQPQMEPSFRLVCGWEDNWKYEVDLFARLSKASMTSQTIVLNSILLLTALQNVICINKLVSGWFTAWTRTAVELIYCLLGIKTFKDTHSSIWVIWFSTEKLKVCYSFCNKLVSFQGEGNSDLRILKDRLMLIERGSLTMYLPSFKRRRLKSCGSGVETIWNCLVLSINFIIWRKIILQHFCIWR